MKKVKVKFIPFKLKGELITKNNELIFKAKNIKDQIVDSSNYKGIKVISVFPEITTKVCDLQTMEISKLANKYKNVMFISISMDTVDTIEKWCEAKGVDNIEIWSDRELGEFGDKTNTLIPIVKKLTRGFIVMKDNTIIDTSFKEDISEMPDFEHLEIYLSNM